MKSCLRETATYGDLDEAMLGGKVEGGVALIREVWVLEVLWVVADDAFHEWEVIAKDSAAQAHRDVNPAKDMSFCRGRGKLRRTSRKHPGGGRLRWAFTTVEVDCLKWGGLRETVKIL